MDMTAVAGALTSVKAAKDIAQTMMGMRDGAMLQAKTIELQSAILDAQSSLLTANEERTALIDRIRQLEQEVARFETWEAEKQRYKLESLPPGVFVYTLKPDMAAGEPPHHICQRCYQNGKKSILHSSEPRNGQHHLTCSECETKLLVGNFRAQPLRYAQGAGDDWPP